MWVPPKIKHPVLQHAPTRKSVACFGAVNLATGTFVRMFCDIFNAETFQDFLRRLLRHRSTRRRMIIVLDNARYHHARLLAAFLRKYRRVFSLLFLPPYGPSSPRSSGSGNSRDAWRRTTGTSPRSPSCSES